MKKIVTLALAALMIAGIAAGCGGTKVGPTQTVYIASRPETLDPTFSASQEDAIYLSHLYETLIVNTGSGTAKYEVGAAESYKASTEIIDEAEYTVYTFVIRDSRWSDGQSVKADDFAFAIERLIDPANNAPYAAEIGQFFYKGSEILEGKATVDALGVEAVDDKTLKCILQYPVSYALEIFASPALSPVRRDVVEANGSGWSLAPETCVTNGMYKLESWDRSAELVMAVNTGNWNSKNVGNGGLIVKHADNPAASLAAVRGDEALYGDSFPSSELSGVQSEGLLHAFPVLGTCYVQMQTSTAPLNDVKVREALTKAIDQATIVGTIPGNVASAAYSLIGPGFSNEEGIGFVQKNYLGEEYERRKSEAKRAFADAGFSNGAGFPEVGLTCTESERPFAEALQGMWKDVLGVDIALNVVGKAEKIAAAQSGGYQLMLRTQTALYANPASMLGAFTSAASKSYASAAFDQKMLDVLAASANIHQFELLGEAEDILMEDYAIAPIYHTAKEMLYKSSVQGVRTSPLGEVYLDGIYKVEEKK